MCQFNTALSSWSLESNKSLLSGAVFSRSSSWVEDSCVSDSHRAYLEKPERRQGTRKAKLNKSSISVNFFCKKNHTKSTILKQTLCVGLWFEGLGSWVGLSWEVIFRGWPSSRVHQWILAVNSVPRPRASSRWVQIYSHGHAGKVLRKKRKSKKQSTGTFHAFIRILSADVLLVKASYTGKPESKYVGIIHGHGHRDHKSLQVSTATIHRQNHERRASTLESFELWGTNQSGPVPMMQGCWARSFLYWLSMAGGDISRPPQWSSCTGEGGPPAQALIHESTGEVQIDCERGRESKKVSAGIWTDCVPALSAPVSPSIALSQHADLLID